MLYIILIVIIIVLLLVIVYLARLSNAQIMLEDNTFNYGISLIAMNIVFITLWILCNHILIKYIIAFLQVVIF
jgi:hypothetical protein